MQRPTENKHACPKIIKLIPKMMVPIKAIMVPAFLYSYWTYTIKHLCIKCMQYSEFKHVMFINDRFQKCFQSTTGRVSSIMHI